MCDRFRLQNVLQDVNACCFSIFVAWCRFADYYINFTLYVCRKYDGTTLVGYQYKFCEDIRVVCTMWSSCLMVQQFPSILGFL